MAAQENTEAVSPASIKKYFDEFLAVAKNEDGWTDVSTKLEVKVTQKSIDESGIAVIKGDGIIKAPAVKVKELLFSGDVKKRAAWDTFFETGETVKEIEKDKVVVIHYKTKSSMTVWSRDFSVVAAVREESDGGYTIIGKSINWVPEVSGCVRAKVLLSGFLLQPTKEGHTRVVYIFQVDAAGWVPAAVVNQVQTYQPLGIIGMRKVITGSPQP